MSLQVLKWRLQFQLKKSHVKHIVHHKAEDILNLETNLCKDKVKEKTDMKTIGQTFLLFNEKVQQRSDYTSKDQTLLKITDLTQCLRA